MKCEEMQLLISGHLDCENTEEEEAQLRAHLTQCSSCRELLQVLRENDEAVKNAAEQAPQTLCANVMQAVRREAAGRRRQSKAWLSLSIAAALVVVMGIGVLSMPGAQKPAEEQLETAAYGSQKMSEEPQTVSFSADTVRMADQPAEACFSLAVEIAEERCADVVLLEELPEELADASYETVEDGWRLYELSSADAASELSVQYQAELTQPTQHDSGCALSYALVKETLPD